MRHGLVQVCLGVRLVEGVGILWAGWGLGGGVGAGW